MGSRSGLVALLVVAAAAAAAVVVGVLVLGGGSGEASRQSFQAAVVNARDRVDFAYGRIARAQSPEDLVQRIDDAAVAIGDTASDLDEAGVPDEFEDEHETLVETLQKFSDSLAGTAAQFSDPTFAGTVTGITSLSFPEWDRANKILADLNEQGIEVEQLARH